MTALRPMLNSRISLRSLALARFPWLAKTLSRSTILATWFVAVVNSATKLVRIEQNCFGKHHRLDLGREWRFALARWGEPKSV